MSDSLDTMIFELADLRKDFLGELNGASDSRHLDGLRIKYLGRKGSVTQYFKTLQRLSPADRPKLGEALNTLKSELQERLDTTHNSLNKENSDQSFDADLSLPGVTRSVGYTNPLLQTYKELTGIFGNMGFKVATGPLIESEYYNFEALNIPEDHPAKDLQDTFYLEQGLLLRTHTSPVQIRTMEKQKPPVRIVAPGRCFRKDAQDATHSPEFTQIEGLAIDEGITFANLKGTLYAFASKFFGEGTRVRFRPSFFPFTEPSAEMDIWWESPQGGRWLEILGCGMVDPNVFDFVGYDSERYTGFAWGMGIERAAMLKFQISDIRHFFENDLRFLNQF